MNSMIDLLMVIFICTIMILVFAGIYQITSILYNYFNKKRGTDMYVKTPAGIGTLINYNAVNKTCLVEMDHEHPVEFNLDDCVLDYDPAKEGV